MSGEGKTGAVGAQGVPLTPTVAQRIIEDILGESPAKTWKRAKLAARVVEVHSEGGGEAGQQRPLYAVKKALRQLAKEGKVENVAPGLYSRTGSPSAETFVDSTAQQTPPAREPTVPKDQDGPMYGNPIDFRGLRHEPVNEIGVVFLFGMVAGELGFLVEAVQAGFPDCEAKRKVGTDKWKRVRIEFEYESRNFRGHRHPPDGCDVIVCWRHNWPECPRNLDVVELRTVIGTLPNERSSRTVNDTIQRTVRAAARR